MRLCAGIMLSDGKCMYPAKVHGQNRYLPGPTSPVQMAKDMEAAGADALFINDMDAFHYGYLVHIDVVREIMNAVDIPVYCGGNIRTIKDIDTYISMGIKRIIINLHTIENARRIEEAINLFDVEAIIGCVQGKNGMITQKVASNSKNFNILTMLTEFEKIGMKYVIFDDFSAIFEKEAPDIVNMKEIIDRTNLKLVYCGRTENMEQIKKLKEIGVFSCMLSFPMNEHPMTIEEIKKALSDSEDIKESENFK